MEDDAMEDDAGVELPPRIKPAKIGHRWLGVIPIAQAAVIGDEVLVQLIALERRAHGAIVTARLSRLEELILTEPRGDVPWPKLQITAQDDVGTTYRVDGGYGNGSQSDWDVEYGLRGAFPGAARRLELTINELRWEDLPSGTVESRTTGAWRFTVDLTLEHPARMV